MFEDKKVSFISALLDQFKTVQVAGLPQMQNERNSICPN